jgi:hypothetical protein
MDFITGLQRRARQDDEIMIVVDRLSKVAHFIPINFTFKAIYVANAFIK